MSSHNAPPPPPDDDNLPRQHQRIGLCLRCGAKLTECGRPFSLAVQCSKCFRINIYIESQHPVRLLSDAEAEIRVP